MSSTPYRSVLAVLLIRLRQPVGLLMTVWFVCLTSFIVLPVNAASNRLTLAQSITKALAFNPKLKSEKLEGRARRAETWQGSLSPNPELSVDVDDFLGSGSVRGFGAADVTVGINKKFELGGKRSARIAKGQAVEDMNYAQREALRREVIVQVSSDYFNVLGAKKNMVLRKKQYRLFETLLAPLKRRVEVGGSPESDLIRGQIAAQQARIAFENAHITLESARQRLASNWSSRLGKTYVLGRLRQPNREAIAITSILKKLNFHPEVKKFEARHSAKIAELDIQKSLSVPDITLGLGVRRFGGNGDMAFVAKGSMPLPFQNTNEGNITAAAERIGKASLSRDALKQNLRRRLVSTYGLLHRNCHETRRYKATITPKARSAVKSIKQGYFNGRFKVVDLLDAISVLTQAEQRETETLVQCRIAATKIKTLTEIDPLTGQKLSRY